MKNRTRIKANIADFDPDRIGYVLQQGVFHFAFLCLLLNENSFC